MPRPERFKSMCPAPGTSHPTATRIDFLDGIRHGKSFLQIARPNQRLFVAVSVNKSLRLLPLEFQLPAPGLFLLNYEFFEEERCLGDSRCVSAFDEIRVFVTECENATRLTADDRITIFNEWLELADIEARIFSGCIGESL